MYGRTVVQDLCDTRGKREKTDFHSLSSFYCLIGLISLTNCMNSYHASQSASLEKRTYVRDNSPFTLPYVISFTRFFPNGSLCDFSFRPENCSPLEYRISICPIFPRVVVNFGLIDMIDRSLRFGSSGYWYTVICHRSCEIPLAREKCTATGRGASDLKRMFKGGCWTWEKVMVLVRRQVDKGPADGKVTLADLNES